MVSEESLPRYSNILSIRRLRTQNPHGSRRNGRIDVPGHTNREKYNVDQDSTTLHQRSIRFVVLIVAMSRLTIWSHCVKQAYLLSDSPLRRDIFLLPPSELKLLKCSYLKLLKSLYGLADSGDYWCSISKKLHRVELLM